MAEDRTCILCGKQVDAGMTNNEGIYAHEECFRDMMNSTTLACSTRNGRKENDMADVRDNGSKKSIADFGAEEETVSNECSEYLSNTIESINIILKDNNAKASDIPESLIAYSIVSGKPDMIRDFLEDGFVALDSNSRFGWMSFL